MDAPYPQTTVGPSEVVLAGRAWRSHAALAAAHTCRSQNAHFSRRARSGFAGTYASDGESGTDDGLRVRPEWALAVRAKGQRRARRRERGGNQAAGLMDCLGRVPSLMRQGGTLRYAAPVTQRCQVLLKRAGARLLGLGEVQTVAGFSGSLLGKHPPGDVNRGVLGDGGLTVGVENLGEFMGPAWGRPVAGIGAVAALTVGGPGRRPAGVPVLSPTIAVGHDYPASMPYPQRTGSVGAGTDRAGAGNGRVATITQPRIYRQPHSWHFCHGSAQKTRIGEDGYG